MTIIRQKYFIVFMTLMNTISGIFIYFVYEDMAISTNLISNITIDTEKGSLSLAFWWMSTFLKVTIQSWT